MSEAARPRPIEACYWLPSHPVLAGEYPGHWELETARERVRRFLDVGVSSFVDLTRSEDRLEPYREILLQEAAAVGLEAVHAPMPITDMGVPSVEEMAAILDRLDEWSRAGRTAYVHCWGGIGRTGTVVGCYLVRHGLDGPTALATVQRLYEMTGKHRTFPRSPQTEDQRRFVMEWSG
jgi:protein-tyrosine phosphatase